GKVHSVERWFAAHTTYSLDAPLAPAGANVVDHFLFVSQEGWCNQIATSLAVLLRVAGVPARFAVGFVPGRVDPVSGRYDVRAKDAHAWTEVWFPKVGWVPFDPTAEVSLSGETTAQAAENFLQRWGPWLALGLAALLVLAPLLWR